MDPKAFLDNFGAIADAPGGIEQLRSLIRDLAVRGRLVAQQDIDGTGNELERRIMSARQGLAQTKRVRLPKYPTTVSAADEPFDAPSSWAWCRFGAIHQKLGAGSTPKGGQKVYVDDGVKFLRSQNVHNDGLRLDGVACIPADVHESMAATVVQPGDVLLNITGASIARATVVPDDFDEANVSQHVAIVRPVLGETNNWVHLFLISPHGYRAIMGAQVGISREGLSMTRLRDLVIPLPPLTEQRRILAKVDELMRLCDDLEDRHQTCQLAGMRFRSSSFASLRAAKADDEFQTAWSRVEANWRTLTSTPLGVQELRTAIRELALRGRLVPQKTSDGTARQLLAALEADRPSNAKPITTPLQEADLHQVPSSWHWAQLGDLLDGIQAGKSPTAQKRPKTASEWGVLKVSACSWGKFLAEENKALLVDTEPNEVFEVQTGDFLISRANTQHLVARSVIVDETPRRLLISDKTLRLSVSPNCDARYLNLANLGPAARSHYERSASGTSDSMRNVSQQVIRAAPIPLPPPAEQIRIVEAADSLLRLCDDLETKLHNRIDTTTALAALLTTVS